MTWLLGIFTDAKDRPEAKMIIGIPAVIMGFIIGALMLLGIVAEKWTGWGIFMANSLVLIGVTAVTDAQIDKRSTRNDDP